ncbi:MAG TPA: mechanosensitive ion channel domain-containing protein [Gemmataceae bacterium]|nr:mechanosensitive ion channel domain-containing protein [Gemmataceae bacterium]
MAIAVALVTMPVFAQSPKFGKPAPAKPKPLAERLTSPRDAGRPVADKLRSPRETLKTLYYAVSLYDLFPEMMEDAIACLDLDGLHPRPAAEDATMLALDLEQVLQTLSIPLASVPDRGLGLEMVIYDADGFKLSLSRSQDMGWRLDADTLQRLPTLRRAAQERRKRRAVDLSNLREGFTDPRATMRQFLAESANGDFHAAARALDLTSFSNEQRRQQGPILAQQLAFVLQHRGFVFRQEVPDAPDGPPYTWHADHNGRIALDRVRLPNGKDSWLFTKQTVRNIPKMYTAAQTIAPAWQYVRLGAVVPPLLDHETTATGKKRPDDVPPHLGSPRALLQGFFRTMEAADKDDSRLADALEYLDLENVPAADRSALGGKLALKLEAVIRKVRLDLSAVPDDWNAGRQVLGEAEGVRVEIQRQSDGCWRFSQATIAHIPEMFDKLAGKAQSDQGHGSHLDSARDTIITFQSAAGRREYSMAAQCLDLSEIHMSAREELGPVLAFKLKYVLDRIGHIYVAEIPDSQEGPRYVLYRGDLGRIALDRTGSDPGKGQWLFTTDTVQRIDPMFRAVFGKPGDQAQQDNAGQTARVDLWGTPGVWMRLQLPAWVQVRAGRLEIYQWFGLAVAALASWAGARLLMASFFSRLVAWLLHRSGSALSTNFVAASLRPLTWLASVWLFFQLLAWLDLPVAVAAAVFSAHKFLLAGLVGWLGLRLIDLSMGVYLNSELLKPHRSLSDMIVPVSVRISKTVVLLVVTTYMIYQIGQIDLLTRFLTGLGVAGLAASLAAQDALKSFFGTLLLIGERAFKIGDRINVSGKEGIVEQVGFRSTRLRTPEGSTLTIPNAVIASAPIDNMGAAKAAVEMGKQANKAA